MSQNPLEHCKTFSKKTLISGWGSNLRWKEKKKRERKKTEKGEKWFCIWKQGNAHILLYIFLQMPKRKNRQATETSNFLTASSFMDSSGCLQADRALGSCSFFKPQMLFQSRKPLGRPGSEQREAGFRTSLFPLRKVQCCLSKTHPWSLNIKLFPYTLSADTWLLSLVWSRCCFQIQVQIEANLS